MWSSWFSQKSALTVEFLLHPAPIAAKPHSDEHSSFSFRCSSRHAHVERSTIDDGLIRADNNSNTKIIIFFFFFIIIIIIIIIIHTNNHVVWRTFGSIV